MAKKGPRCTGEHIEPGPYQVVVNWLRVFPIGSSNNQPPTTPLGDVRIRLDVNNSCCFIQI